MIIENINNLILETENKQQYKIHGAIEGCLDVSINSLGIGLYRTETLKNDPWIAVIATKGPITKSELDNFHSHYILDPDKGNVPYYYCVDDVINNKKYIKYTNSDRLFNYKEAYDYGIKIGIPKEQLDFK
jgi:hypothetical protein